MDPEPPNPSRGTGLWLQWADTDGVRSDAEGKASDVIAMDNRETATSTGYSGGPTVRGRRPPKRRLATSPSRGLCEARTGRQGGEIDFDVDPSQVIDPEQGIVPRRPMPAGGERSIAIPVAGPRKARRANSCLPMAGFRP